jgi:hydrogenase maturation protein HypF
MVESVTRKSYDIEGIVQGVGFRPTLYRLAVEAGLAGWVQNRTGVVRLVLEGPGETIDRFIDRLPARVQEPGRIAAITLVDTAGSTDAVALDGFSIIESSSDDEVRITIPADLAVCNECLDEIADPGNRRYRYAFTTCTLCGPRYTVVNGMPYDRERTTMQPFQLCEQCRNEYENPSDRRFHAETIACPECGPSPALKDAAACSIDGDAIAGAQTALADGLILAVRGIGGYLLAADAFSREALENLRTRKRRPHKPFAVMARDMETIMRYCEVPDAAIPVLQSRERPIVIMDVKSCIVEEGLLPLDLITPDTGTMGVMLPTSPLHELLLAPAPREGTGGFELLIMTSGNKRGEPICLSNSEAEKALTGIADRFLEHNREINLRNDDSLTIVQCDKAQVWRRARGYVPHPIPVAPALDRCVLALGAEIKNAVAIGYDNEVVLSPHIGDLETPEALDGFRQVADCLPGFLDKTPEALAVDLHPDMHSTIAGERMAENLGIPLVRVQHHHAHAAACLAEHGRESGLCLVLDGTGYGGDGTIWGAELIRVEPDAFQRLATFSPVPLPGGDAAVNQPARQVIGRWIHADVPFTNDWFSLLGIEEAEANVWSRQCSGGINAPLSHAAGRVFDAFSAILGVAPRHVTYEGQPAIRLEAVARECPDHAGLPEVRYTTAEEEGILYIDWTPAFAAMAENPGRIVEKRQTWALAIHHAVARASLEMIQYGLSLCGEECIGLSGGVFMNRILNDLLVTALSDKGIDTLIHRQVPPNDGGIAFGQAIIAGRHT